jgi:6,7-dimethyl-8-ribityllumazine synthase
MSASRTSHPQLPQLALVQSCWHREIVEEGRNGFLEEPATRDNAQVKVFEVPGAFELPLHSRLLAESGRFDAVAAIGFVVDGGIYRHEFVAQAVIDGLMRVQLDTNVPVFSGVLTPQQFHEHDVHHDFFFRHMREKGQELARATLLTLNARKLVTTSP